MENMYTQTYEVANPLIYLGRWEFIFYIVAAFVVGYLVHYVFSKRRDYVRTPKKRPSFYYSDTLNTAYYPNSEPIQPQAIAHTNIQQKSSHYLPIQNNNYEMYHPQEIVHNVPQQNFVAPEKQTHISAQDDLKMVEGIGPKIEEILNKSKIKTWHELSRTSTDELKSILNGAGKRFQMHDPSSWPEQAHLADTKQWAALQQFQDYLDGGKYIAA